MIDSPQSIFTPRDWATLRWVFRIYGAVLLVIALIVLFSGKSFAGLVLGGLALMWLVALGLGFFYLVRLRQAKRPWYWPLVSNIPLLIISYIASALALPVFAATIASVGGHRPALAQFLIDLSHFLKAWWWVLLTIGYAMLGLFAEASTRRDGPSSATRWLRWLMAAQIIYVVALGATTLLAQRSSSAH